MLKKIVVGILLIFLFISNQVGNVNAQTNSTSDSEATILEQSISSVLVENSNIMINDFQQVIITLSNEIQPDAKFSLHYINLDTKEEFFEENSSIEGSSICFSFNMHDKGEYQITEVDFATNEGTIFFNLAELGLDVKFGVDEEVYTSPDYILVDKPQIETQYTKIMSALPVISTSISNKPLVVVLDPGHGGSDPGATRIFNGVQYKERDLVLKIAEACAQELLSYANVKVYKTRSNNTSINLNRAERIAYAKSVGADVIVSLHLNSTGPTTDSLTTATGAEIYVPNQNYKPEVGKAGTELGNSILQSLVSNGIVNRGTKEITCVDTTYPDGSKADNYGINYYAKLEGFPGIIVEHCFLNNSLDFEKYLNTDLKLKLLGIADARGIAKYYNLSKLMINIESTTMYLGITQQLTATFEGTIVPNNSLIWKSSDTGVASIDVNGIVTANKEGSCIISCETSTGVVTSCAVKVEPRLKLNTNSYTCYPDQISTFAVFFEGRRKDNSLVEWSTSNQNVAKIDENGNIQGISPGQAIISITDKANNLSYDCIVNVLEKKIVSLNANTFTMYSGTKSAFAAYIDGIIVNNNQMEWKSSDETVAKVDTDGKIYGLKRGETAISCTTPNGTIASCYVKVLPIIKINTSIYRCYPNQQSKFAISFDGFNTPNTSVEWYSSDNSIAKVDTSGNILGVKKGIVVITAKDKESISSSQCTVEVLDNKVVSLKESSIKILANSNYELVSFIDGILASNLKMNWSSSDDQIAIVDQNGTVYGLKSGTAIISCTTLYGTTATCEITILPIVRINASFYKCYPGQKSNFAVTIDGLKVENSFVNWESNNSDIARVDSNGYIYGVNSGKAIITAKDKITGSFSECIVEVINKKNVNLNTDKFNMRSNTSSIFASYVDGKKVENTQMKWSSSNEQVVRVDSFGKIYAIKGGTAIISCTTQYGTIAKCVVTVMTNLNINTNYFKCYPDQKSAFALSLSGVKVPNAFAEWTSSNSNIVKVDSNGNIQGISSGNAIISARDKSTGEVSQCIVEVLERKMVSLNTNMFTMHSGSKSAFSSFVNGIKVNNSTMKWNSSNEQVLSVDYNGNIYGIKEGVATISCTTAYGTIASCVVNVLPTLKINTNYYVCYQEQKSIFAVSIDGLKVANNSVSWVSLNPDVAMVDANGNITGISPGNTTIIAKDESRSLLSTCQVKVINKKVVKLNTNSFNMYITSKSQFAVSVDGKVVSNSQVQWSSSDESIVTVDNEGRITAKQIGFTTISCTTQNGTKDTCLINVYGTEINGLNVFSAQQMAAYYMSKVQAYSVKDYPIFYKDSDAPTILRFCEIYIEEGKKEGIRGDLAFCQAMLETGFLQKFSPYSSVSIENFNFAGLGATGTADAPIAKFSSVRVGIRAQIQHLKAYSTPSTVKINQTIVDPRFDLVTRGKAPYVEWLGQKENPQGYGWATGLNYGYSIMRIYKELSSIK